MGHCFLIFTIFSLSFLISSIQGGRLWTMFPMHGIHAYSRISMPPSPAPAASSPSYYHGPYDYPSPAPSPSIGPEGVFNVRSFGAVGDGVTDDTSAFKEAWDAACQVENGKVLAPRGHSFLVQPVIFSGPCKSGLVFQVIDKT